jgi:hypothetical protein
MNSTFKQCAAFKPDGVQCGRVANDGDHCYSHRHHQSRASTQPTPAYRIKHHCLTCSDCGHLIPPDKARVLAVNISPGVLDEVLQVRCEPCDRLRQQIETRIVEICAASPTGILADEIYTDLEQFGVDQDLVEDARLRLHADGRLVHE